MPAQEKISSTATRPAFDAILTQASPALYAVIAILQGHISLESAMGAYKRILALVSLNGDSATVAKRAAQFSRTYGATLALASVVDYTPGFESDHVPFLTPEEMRQAIVRDMRERLQQMMTEVGAGGCEIIVGCGSEQEVVFELTRSWRPDLVLVGSHARHGLEQNSGRAAYDVLTVQSNRPSLAGRMINALAAAL